MRSDLAAALRRFSARMAGDSATAAAELYDAIRTMGGIDAVLAEPVPPAPADAWDRAVPEARAVALDVLGQDVRELRAELAQTRADLAALRADHRLLEGDLRRVEDALLEVVP